MTDVLERLDRYLETFQGRTRMRRRLRFLTGGLALLFFVLSVVTVVQFGKQALADHDFVGAFSTAHVGKRVAAAPAPPDAPAPGGSYLYTGFGAGRAQQGSSLEPGDLVVEVGEVSVHSERDVTRALAKQTDPVEVMALRPPVRGAVALYVPPAALGEAVNDVGPSLIVTTLAAGGTSDRAGMQVGDLIIRINGQPFSNRDGADSLIRGAEPGRAIDYDILRRSNARTLHVRPVSLQFTFGFLAIVVAGVLWMLLGAFLALARPHIPAARYRGLAFLLIGYALTVAWTRPYISSSAFHFGLDLLFQAALFVGIAVWVHSVQYFPRERPLLRARRWALPVVYGCAVLAAAVPLASRADLVTFMARTFIALAFMLLLGCLVTWRTNRDRSANEAEIMRPLVRLRNLTLIGIALGVVWLGSFGQGRFGPGFLAAALVAVPFVNLYVIARYRLLELNLRVRRNVAYVAASTAWTLIVVAVGVSAVWQLAQIAMPIPNIRFSAQSVQVVDAPEQAEERAALERALLMIAAVALTFGLRSVRRRGQRVIDARFYRKDVDYRVVVRGLGRVLATRVSRDELAAELVAGVDRLLPLKRSAVILVRGTQLVIPREARGLSAEEWQALASHVGDDALQAVQKAEREVHAEYAIPRLRRPLEAARIQHLYPIRHDDAVVGVLLLGEKQAESAFTSDDFEFIDAVAAQAGVAIENAFLYDRVAEQERLKHELELARRIQMASLPQTTPRVDGLDVAARSVPALEVGGDFFDYLTNPPNRLGIVVGDVSGKGTSAAFYMSKVQGILRSLHSFDLAPCELFVRANDLLLSDLEKRWFVTALGAFFDTTTRRLLLTRAGHLPLYHFEKATGNVQSLLPRGIGFGLSPRAVFAAELAQAEVEYAAGDAFLLITDGVTECGDTLDAQFGEERVITAFRTASHNGASATAIVERLLLELDAFSAGRTPFDDQTLVVVRAQ
ncbi:MAG: SpoIIE family protein phosphatase [Luteitalea sp.]|nr:SpoIIE family protein phosphatase [Luteitalea sp.]